MGSNREILKGNKILMVAIIFSPTIHVLILFYLCSLFHSFSSEYLIFLTFILFTISKDIIGTLGKEVKSDNFCYCKVVRVIVK